MKYFSLAQQLYLNTRKDSDTEYLTKSQIEQRCKRKEEFRPNVELINYDGITLSFVGLDFGASALHVDGPALRLRNVTAERVVYSAHQNKYSTFLDHDLELHKCRIPLVDVASARVEMSYNDTLTNVNATNCSHFHLFLNRSLTQLSVNNFDHIEYLNIDGCPLENTEEYKIYDLVHQDGGRKQKMYSNGRTIFTGDFKGTQEDLVQLYVQTAQEYQTDADQQIDKFAQEMQAFENDIRKQRTKKLNELNGGITHDKHNATRMIALAGQIQDYKFV